MQELWELLVSAQDTIGGIPTKFLEQKKEEIRQKKVKSEAIDLREGRREEERGDMKVWRSEECVLVTCVSVLCVVISFVFWRAKFIGTVSFFKCFQILSPASLSLGLSYS